MKTKVILLADVPGVGKKGTVAEVASGYARNYLVKNSLAQIATASSISNLAYNVEQADKKSAKAKARAEEIKQKIEDKTITISAKAGPSGTLFGSITADMISKAMKRDLNIVMDKKSVELDEPIKSTGIHTIPVKLHHEVVAELKLAIVPQSK